MNKSKLPFSFKGYIGTDENPEVIHDTRSLGSYYKEMCLLLVYLSDKKSQLCAYITVIHSAFNSGLHPGGQQCFNPFSKTGMTL